jgi:hypothetical protein
MGFDVNMTFNWFWNYFSIGKGHESGSQSYGPMVSVGPWSTVDQAAWSCRCSPKMGAQPLRGSGACHNYMGRRRRSGRSLSTTKDGGGQQIQASSGGERRWPWMLVEVRFLSDKEGKWERESCVMEGGRL